MKKSTNLVWTLVFMLTLSTFYSGFAQIQNSRTKAEEFRNYVRLYKQEKQNRLQKKSSESKESYQMPLGVNPFTSYLSNKGNARQWSKYYYDLAQAKKRTKLGKKRSMATFTEKEEPGKNLNDTISSAEPIPNFGSSQNNTNEFQINGILDREVGPDFNFEFFDSEEDNGSIPLATPIELSEPLTDFVTQARIGDGPQGAASGGNGDFDFYKVSLKETELVELSALSLDTTAIRLIILVFNEQGEELDFSFPAAITFIDFIAPATGNYYFAVYDFETLIGSESETEPLQPFDSASGGGVVSEGDYQFQLTYYGETPDTDFYSFSLKKGDVFGIAIDGITPTNTSLFLDDNDLGIGTRFFQNFLTQESPLPDDGFTSFSYVIPEDGDYKLSIGGSVGSYTAEIIASRPGFETNKKGQKQIIYLDYTGAKTTQKELLDIPDSIAVGNEEVNRIRLLSPFEDFLTNWGVENTTLNRVRLIYEIDKVVKENLKKELKEQWINPDLDVLILSDLGSNFLGDNIPKILNRANISFSKVIVGGTIEESGIETLGIASAIDIGNFSFEDQALVLLDELSNVNPDNPNSINNILRTDDVPIEELVTVVLGNVIAHEIGHYLGNFHTSNENDVFSIMDEGGNINGLAGITDGAFGDSNTVNVDFAKDVYSNFEGFFPEGSNQTDVNTAFALGFVPFGRKSSYDKTIPELLALENQVLNELQEVVSEEILSYPNPQSVSGTASLQLGTEVYGATKVMVLDMHGRTIQTVFDGVINQGENKVITTDAQNLNLSRGMYTYAIKSNNKTFSHKFVVN
ncbi:T9SS type A sorting domain-containing protein [Aquimarina sp. ERC-38]|uniref:T9SS type A sorting domain-containing protein n=1 Tax=Aquimarina sp. ERC-38 TaxID=2949996 RepID=UPI0022483D03|nr:T9SS type A sorting domain-containing protein [Aquimarina sp. ERC-38]UZO82539.1 T9SS type A sorting domain-containing protein [Aquimarina sp. ERC-38]